VTTASASSASSVPSVVSARYPSFAAVLGQCDRALDFARRQFGITDWRPLQAEAVAAAFANRDALVVMGTGCGKSLCFQVPALMRTGLTVVVSPLLALMKDQIDALSGHGFPVAAMNSGTHHRADDEMARFAVQGRLRMLYVSPERCLRPDFIDLLDRCRPRLNAFVIDEAHCISQWGFDFRKAYASLGSLRVLHPDVPIHAYTATATPRVREQIMRSLGFHLPPCQGGTQGGPSDQNRDREGADDVNDQGPKATRHEGSIANRQSSISNSSGATALEQCPIMLVGPFDRPELFLRVYAGRRTDRDLIDEVRELQAKHGHALSHVPSGIVYCITRAETERVAELLRDAGVAAEAYHAGLDVSVRAQIQSRFLNSAFNIPHSSDASPLAKGGSRGVDVVVATIAFGMGIHKPDVRFVIHWGMCSSVDIYHQEIGRAGRDGRPADCVTFWHDQDYFAWRDLFESAEQGGGPPITDGKMDALSDIEAYCAIKYRDGGLPRCRHAWLREYFAPPPLPRGDQGGSPLSSPRGDPEGSLRPMPTGDERELGPPSACSACDVCVGASHA